MLRKIQVIILPLVLVWITACNQAPRPEHLKIRIIETSDVHGALLPYDLVEDKPTDHSLAQVYTYVKQQRSNPDQVTLLLDNGDILQGDPMVYYSNFENTSDEHIVAQVMNYMKYDAATIGNHDIEPGHGVYDKLTDEFDFPWLAANAVSTATGKPYFEPYTMLDTNGVKIAVLGMITPAIPKWLPPQIWAGISFDDMIGSANYWVDYIRENENPDLLIGLFHAGVDANYGGQSADTPRNENASRLVAEQVPGFDVVFVGHDHHGWNEKVLNQDGQEVHILGPTSRARDVAVADIDLNLNKSAGAYQKAIAGYIVDMKDVDPDKDFVEKFQPYFKQVEAYVSKPIGYLKENLYTRNALFGDAAFTDLIKQAQLDVSGAQISFAAPLSFNKTIHAGTIEVRDMFNLYRYENLLYTMKLDGQEIKDYLEYSYGLWFNTMKNASGHLLKFKNDPPADPPKLENAYYNFDAAEGINYTVDVSKPVGERISITSTANGDPFDPDQVYEVAVNSYRGNGGGGHLTAGAKIRSELLPDRILNSTEKDFRYYLMQWIEEKDTLDPKADFNWKVVPESWARQGRKRDSELLFGKP